MAIFGFKKRKDEKLEQEAQVAKKAPEKVSYRDQKMQISGKSNRVSKDMVAKKISMPTLDSSADSNLASVIIRPRITEKSGILSQNGVYTFEVMKNANKAMISKAISTIYKVNPINVAMINTPIKNVFVKGRKGTVAGIRKAIVTLKKGEKIDFV